MAEIYHRNAQSCCQKEIDKLWGSIPIVLRFESEEEFEKIRKSIHDVILKTMKLHPYNTMDTFSNFHQAYRSRKSDLSVSEFLQSYPFHSLDISLSCIGLSVKCMRYISEDVPIVSNHLYLVVGNEYPLETPEPTQKDPPLPEVVRGKEHVLAVIKFCLMGRKGYLLMDLGLSLDFPVVVMKDGLPPHTGLFKQMSRVGFREYSIDMAKNSTTYVNWFIREFKGDTILVNRQRFLFLGLKFLKPDYLERRNLVYHYHGYVLMGSGGVLAGLYFVLGKDDRRFTVFVNDEKEGMQSAQLPYEHFLSVQDRTDTGLEGEIASEDAVRLLEAFGRVCGLGSLSEVTARFRPLSEACCDLPFIEQVQNLNLKLVTSVLDVTW